MEEMQKARTVDMIAAEINALTASMLNNIVEIGRRMVEAKEMLPYGTFGKWIVENTGYSSSTAENFMRIFKEYGSAQGSLFGDNVESQTFGKLSYSKALALLDVPAEERESFAEEHHAAEISTRELKQAIRERNEALQAAEAAKAELDEAEESRAKMEEDMRHLKELQQRSKEAALKKAQKELQQAKEEAGAAQRKLEAAEREAAEARQAAEKAGKLEKANVNQNMARFSVLFQQTQDTVNRMAETLRTETAENQGKMRAALLALSGAIRKAAEE
jgi:chromosome segregation ATPase